MLAQALNRFVLRDLDGDDGWRSDGGAPDVLPPTLHCRGARTCAWHPIVRCGASAPQPPAASEEPERASWIPLPAGGAASSSDGDGRVDTGVVYEVVVDEVTGRPSMRTPGGEVVRHMYPHTVRSLEEVRKGAGARACMHVHLGGHASPTYSSTCTYMLRGRTVRTTARSPTGKVTARAVCCAGLARRDGV